jgi:hypothetical protein
MAAGERDEQIQLVELKHQAQKILLGNDRGGYTVPTASLYPFQWNWDSAFCAIGFATFDKMRAIEEIESLYLGQWPTGFVPHIVFHQEARSYFPGPEIWRCPHLPHSSGISQPPLTATALRLIMEGSEGDSGLMDRAGQLYPKILASHDWWARDRDPEESGLVAILHPWESGADNSPVWDAALDRVPATKTAYVRRDTDLINPQMRPRKHEYDRFIYLVELYRGLDWDGTRMWQAAPFKVADIALNAILQRDESDLRYLAERFGSAKDRAILEKRAERRAAAIDGLWDDRLGLYLSRDLIDGRLIEVSSHAGFLPLWGARLDLRRVHALATTLSARRAQSRFGLATIAPKDPLFDSRRYWRGPIWAVINYMLGHGLSENGRPDLAEILRKDTATVIRQSGFYEYFDPMTGEGLGGGDFSWTAAIGLAWALV